MKERGNFWLRFLDRYAGIPFLSALSLFKRSAELSEKINSILIIKVGTIGDTLLLMPVLKAIKEKHPKISLTVIGSKNNYEVLNRYSFIDSLKIFEVSRIIKEPSYFVRFIKDINSREYDIVIDFEPWPRVSAILSFFIKTGYKIGFKTKGQFRHLIFDAAIPHSSNCHEIENYASLAKVIGISVSDFQAGFSITDTEKGFVESALKNEGHLSDNLILFHPWSSGYSGHLKEWGLENFIALAKALAREGFCVGITGTKDDELRARDLIVACPGNAISFCGKFTIGQTAYLIKKSHFLITVNTGIMHLGAALNHPMIALHGPAGVLRWGPIGSSNAYNIESDFDCAPCLNLGFDYACKNGGCMDAIKVETVAEKAYEILRNRPFPIKKLEDKFRGAFKNADACP